MIIRRTVSKDLTMPDNRWLPAGFRAPARLDLRTGDHLRPIREDDIDVDYPTVMANQPLLWKTFGGVWGWPPDDLTREQDLADLKRHVAEMQRNQSFNYAIFSADDAALKGCVYIDPPERVGADADVSWWLVADERGGPLEQALLEQVPRWLAEYWPFQAPRIIGVDLTWEQWTDLPER